MPGLPDDPAPRSGIVLVHPLERIDLGEDRRALVDWRSGGWVRTDLDGERSITEADGVDAASLDPDLVDALWHRGLVSVGGQEPFSEERFEQDLERCREYYTLVFVLSPGCNLVCSYCYLGHELPKRSERFSVESATALFEQALELDPRGVLVDFGEIAVATDLFVELITAFRARARARGAEVWFSAQTNGTSIDDELLAAVGGDDLLLSISLDGPVDVHDAARTHRGGAGSFSAASRAVAVAGRAGIRTNLIATIGRHNVEHPAEVVAELLRHAPDRYLLKPVLAQGEAEAAWDVVGVSAPEYAAFVEAAFDAGFERGLAGLDQTALKFLHRLCGSPLGWRDACTSRWCGSGRDLHVATSDGRLHACPRFVDDAPATGPTTVVLRTKPRLDRDLLVEELRQPHASCDGCEWYRTCGGGCTLAGGLQARDPSCDSYRSLFLRLIREVVPRLLDDPGADARALGVAVRRVRPLPAPVR